MRLRRIGCQRPMYTIRKLERPQRRMLSPIARSGHIHESRYNCYIHKQNSECSNQESCIPHGDGNQCWRWKNLFYCPLTIRLVYLHQVCGPEWAAKTLPASVISMILCVCVITEDTRIQTQNTHTDMHACKVPWWLVVSLASPFYQFTHWIGRANDAFNHFFVAWFHVALSLLIIMRMVVSASSCATTAMVKKCCVPNSNFCGKCVDVHVCVWNCLIVLWIFETV